MRDCCYLCSILLFLVGILFCLCFPAVFFQGLLEFHWWISLAIAWGHFTISNWPKVSNLDVIMGIFLHMLTKVSFSAHYLGVMVSWNRMFFLQVARNLTIYKEFSGRSTASGRWHLVEGDMETRRGMSFCHFAVYICTISREDMIVLNSLLWNHLATLTTPLF